MPKKLADTEHDVPAAAPRAILKYTGPAYRNRIILPGSLLQVDPRSWTETEIEQHLRQYPANGKYFSRK